MLSCIRIEPEVGRFCCSATMVKRCHWDTDDTTERPKCHLLQKVPKVVRTGDETKDSDMNMRRTAFCYVLETLWLKLELSMACQSFLVNRIDADGKKAQSDEFQELSKLGKLEESWVAYFVSKLTKQTLAKLKDAQAFEDESLKQVLIFLLVAPLSLRMPPECRNKHVCEEVLQSREKDCGLRSKLLMPMPFIVSEKGLNWGACGVYILEWKTGEKSAEAAAVVHRPTRTRVALPAAAVVNKEFCIVSNWDDMNAMLVHGPVKHRISDFFDKGVGPHSVAVWSGKCAPLVNLAKTIGEANEQLKNQERANEATAEEWGAGKSKRPSAAIEKAREALRQRKADKETKRQVALSTV